MNVGMGTLGQLGPGPASTVACGASPCGVFDYVWLSDACEAYLACADPTNIVYTTVTQGALNTVSQAAGSAVASTASSVVSGVATGVADSTGIPTALIYVAAAVAAYFIIKDLAK